MIKILRVVFFVLIISFMFSCDVTDPEYTDYGVEFGFEVNYFNLNADTLYNSKIHSADIRFISKQEKIYYFYDETYNDSLSILLTGFSDSIPFLKDSTYQIQCMLNPGWPTTSGIIIKQESDLIFQGITDWGINKTISLIDSTDLKVKIHKRLTNEIAYTSGCNNKIIPLEINFSLGLSNSYLKQNGSTNIKGYKLRLGVAREIEYSGNCLDDGINGISFTLVNTVP